MVGGGRGGGVECGIEERGQDAERKAAGSAGSAIGAGITAMHKEERSVSWSGQQRGGVGNMVAARRNLKCGSNEAEVARGVRSDGRPLLRITVIIIVRIGTWQNLKYFDLLKQTQENEDISELTYLYI
jgi:hypothetical protein